jgi:hypothetical protein
MENNLTPEKYIIVENEYDSNIKATLDMILYEIEHGDNLVVRDIHITTKSPGSKFSVIIYFDKIKKNKSINFVNDCI